MADNENLSRQDRIENHLKLARSHTVQANKYRELASARRRHLIGVVTEEHLTRAKAGNELSMKLLRQPVRLEAAVDRRASDDADWKGHVANNQWYIKQSLMESNMAIMEIQYNQHLEGNK